MQIRYDPKILSLSDAVRGNFWAGDGEEPIVTKNVLNDAGSASIRISRRPDSDAVSGAGALLTLNFKAVGRGATTISVPGLTLLDAQGKTVGSGNPQVTVNIK
jgi:hypothetical protein